MNQLEVTELFKAIFGDLPQPALSTETNPEIFLRATIVEGIQPLLYYKLRNSGALAAWPDSFTTPLKHEFFRQGAFHYRLEGELSNVIAELAKVDVPLLLLKGIPLSYTHYPEPCLRPVTDTDILVNSADIVKIDRVLDNLGYKKLNAVDGEMILQQACYVKEIHRGWPYVLDVHWKVSNRHAFSESLSFSELTARAIPVTALGQGAMTLCAADALLLACQHRVAHHDNSDRLIWLYDIHLLAENLSPAEKHDFLEIAAAKKMQAVCGEGLALAHSWFGGNATETLSRLCQIQQEGNQKEPSALYLKKANRMADEWVTDFKVLSWRKRWRWLRENLFPSVTYMKQQYKITGLQLPLAYLQRLTKGLKKGLTGRNK